MMCRVQGLLIIFNVTRNNRYIRLFVIFVESIRETDESDNDWHYYDAM